MTQLDHLELAVEALIHAFHQSKRQESVAFWAKIEEARDQLKAARHQAALTGTACSVLTATALTTLTPFTSQAVLTGLSAGTAYWLDAALSCDTAGQYCGIQNVSILAVEF